MNKLLFLIFFILLNCQLQDSTRNHGILFLENRTNKIIVNKSNKNDIINIIGEPHSKSFDNENTWIYVERILIKGKYHKLGRHSLKTNNVLVLDFDKYGVLSGKKLFDKSDISKISFSKKETQNELAQKSFVVNFLQSIKQKMYGNK
ncbi:outer membrane protein assembly factor BamE [Pelagibacteraceae bacterium]|jgi:outer membrane protein assembly factor BamE (lipoprotein component of BamABCDE complex)|nr:outer membrane protein assembly factor BamE [Pelagibacteraceae bacterium]MDC0366246.1 outer membrane protein assembly factor BamE [Pelagibacteraceae bacterium]|tara:strand:+ start:408 stop:848 length:441 start_codon:yes stop_codon:yes gene_type:complete